VNSRSSINFDAFHFRNVVSRSLPHSGQEVDGSHRISTLTLGRDFLFLNLLGLTILTGFVVEVMRYKGAIQFIQPFYLLHLVIVATLFLTAPFTRFAHAFVVPALVALTALGDAVTASGKALGFAWEPAPGRHHKSMRIAECVLRNLEPAHERAIRIRYFP
jgi:hypothetical protein